MELKKQHNCLTPPPRDFLTKISKNDNITLITSEIISIKILEDQKDFFYRKCQFLENEEKYWKKY